MILIADSGSTKSDWLAIDRKGVECSRFNTMGFNPYFHSSEKIESELKQSSEFMKIAESIEKCFFYGSGASSPGMCERVRKGLEQVLPNAEIHVGHDLDGAAYSTWTGTPAVTCILGTGSNSCFFDGENVSEEVPSLAYILGDEGSGSYFGKRLLRAYFYNKLPIEIKNDFEEYFGEENTKLTYVNKRVYMEPGPNVYLASFNEFIGRHKNHPVIEEWLIEGFEEFIDIHVECFENCKNVPIHFIGSIAYHFNEALKIACEKRGLTMGNLIKKPIDGLAQYHLDYVL